MKYIIAGINAAGALEYFLSPGHGVTRYRLRAYKYDKETAEKKRNDTLGRPYLALPEDYTVQQIEEAILLDEITEKIK